MEFIYGCIYIFVMNNSRSDKSDYIQTIHTLQVKMNDYIIYHIYLVNYVQNLHAG